MLRLIFFLLFLIASVWLGVEVVKHPGFLFISYQPWVIQMPVWFAAICFILTLLIFYFLITSIDRIGFTWYRFKNWISLKREHRSHNKTQLGLIMLIEGRWKKAEHLLLKGLKQSVEPLTNYLAAAKAAHKQGAFDRRDRYLQKAHQVAPKEEIAIGLVQASLEYDEQKYEHALLTLNHLRQLSPRHPEVIKLLEKVYVRIGDWQHLQLLLPAMRKSKLLDSREYDLFEENVYCEIFHQAANKRLSDIRDIWQKVPRYLKKRPKVITAYVTQLAKFAPITGTETTKEMETLIRQVLKHSYSPTLTRLYGNLNLNNLNRQLVIVGAWVKIHGQQPELLLVLGKMCVRLQLWGRAKEYFAKCLSQHACPDAALHYGRLLEQLGEKEEAIQVYREGLGQVGQDQAAVSLKH